MTKIDIISGFLGAGKTTLIKKLIAEALQGQKVVLIENEFGEIGIDGGFLKESGIQINEMNSGCICCSLVGDFNAALKDVLSQYEPDRIIIEPSGVGKLSDVIKAVQKVVDGENVVLDSYITVADVKRAKMYLKNFGEFYKNQVQYASAIILSRTQDVEEDKLEKTIELIRTLNDRSPIVTTPWEDITGGQILAVMEGKNDFAEELLREAEENTAIMKTMTIIMSTMKITTTVTTKITIMVTTVTMTTTDMIMTTVTMKTMTIIMSTMKIMTTAVMTIITVMKAIIMPMKYLPAGVRRRRRSSQKEQVRGILEKLADEDSREYGIILRAKGIVPDEEGRWLHFDLVPGEEEVRYGSAEYTGRICVIGSELKEDKLMELFGL